MHSPGFPGYTRAMDTPPTPQSPVPPSAPTPSPEPGRRWGKIILIVLLVLFVLMSGCAMVVGGFFAYGVKQMAENPAMIERMIEQNSGMEIDRDADGNMTFTDEEGRTMTMSGNMGMGMGGLPFDPASPKPLPSDFPKNFPIPAGATSHGGMKVSADGMTAYTAMWNFEQDMASVMAAYERMLQSGGWTKTSTMNFEGSGLLMYKKEGSTAMTKHSLMLQLMEKDDGTQVYGMMGMDVPEDGERDMGEEFPSDFGADGFED